jgi:hypothetical protein
VVGVDDGMPFKEVLIDEIGNKENPHRLAVAERFSVLKFRSCQSAFLANDLLKRRCEGTGAN